MNKQAEIMKLVTALGEYYREALTPGQVAMYSHDLMALDPEQLAQAIDTYRNDPRNDRFPLPAKLKARVGLAISPEDAAIQISGRILGAVAAIGPYRPQEAREAIGEIGWHVVQAEGGWQTICEIKTDDIPIRKAQWRNMARTFCEGGVPRAHPQLPDPANSPIKLDFLKRIPE